MTKTRVMIVGEEETSRKLLKGGLEREGFEVVACTGAADAETRFKAAPVGVLVTDAAMTGKDGFALMEWVKTRDPRCRVILLAARAEKEVAIRALKWGAADYFEKPVDTAALVHAVRRCAEERQAEDAKSEQIAALEERAARAEAAAGGGTWFVSKSPTMNLVNECITVLRRESMRGEGEEPSVLIVGEDGTGREGIARMIHAGSRRGRGPWVTVNCANFPTEQLESELFGHEKGAFTGATALRRGALELARGGTLFIERVSMMDSRLQARLVRALQEKTFTRMGGGSEIRTDVRVIATSDLPLEKAVESGAFRDDLFHRISRMAITVPALRDRMHDVIPMATQFARRAAMARGTKFGGFTAESQAALQGYRWPGNVRELLTVVERAVLLAPKTGEKVDVCGFLGAAPASRVAPVPPPQAVAAGSEGAAAEGVTGEGARITIVRSESTARVLQLQDAMESYTTLKKRWSFSFEREYLVAILNRHDGNVSAAAREAHLDRSNFLRLLRRHRMTAQEFRKESEIEATVEVEKKAA